MHGLYDDIKKTVKSQSTVDLTQGCPSFSIAGRITFIYMKYGRQ